MNNVLVPTKRLLEALPAQDIDNDLISSLKSKLESLADDVPCPDEKYYKPRISWLKRNEWDKFHGEISDCHIYPNGSSTVQNLFESMSAQTIKQVQTFDDKSQYNWKLTFKNGRHAIFKPKRFGINYETNPNHFYFDDFERHHAEIAAFHLDRLLGFRRVIPSIGHSLRIDDMVAKAIPPDPAKPLKPLIESFISPAKAQCIYDSCGKYCSAGHAICGNNGTIEGVLKVWLPEFDTTPIVDSPYKKKFSKNIINNDYELETKQTDGTFCDSTLKSQEEYKKGRRLLDLVDLYIFDYITGNQDRDYYRTFSFRGQKSEAYIFVTENAKAFGNPHKDDRHILAVLTQCCIVRPSTVKTLLKFYNGTSLGTALDESLKADPLYPLLARKYLVAVDRRVKKVLKKVKKCLDKTDDAKTVLMNHFDHESHARSEHRNSDG